MAARVVQLCDAIVTRIESVWAGLLTEPARVPAEAVERVYLPDVTDPTRLKCRKVFVYPLRYGDEDTGGSRHEDGKRYQIGVDVYEKYTGAGIPSKEWLDERVAFVEAIYDDLGDPRIGKRLPPPFQDVESEAAVVSVVYDDVRLRNDGLFASALDLQFRRDEA